MSVIHISNAVIQEISSERGTTFVTVNYTEGPGNRRNEQTLRLVIGPRTIILDRNGAFVPPGTLTVGMVINAAVSAAMTRSIPPQTNAYLIEIVSMPMPENVVFGRILDVNRRDRNFTTISDRDFFSRIRFQVNEDTRIRDRFGRPMEFSRLVPGMQVQVRHANFMTASIPPQTNALEVRVL